MSFSGEVKEELSKQMSSARHCQLSELTGILSMCGNLMISSRGEEKIRVETENLALARKYTALLRKAFKIRPEVRLRVGRNNLYVLMITDPVQARMILDETLLAEEESEKDCCKRAFLRGVFLCTGTMSDPEGAYHLEFVCPSVERAEQIRELAEHFHIPARIAARKSNQIVYIKEGSAVVDMLGVMEAHVSLMKLENVRILREMRGNVNRKVNCETANINKTVSSAVRQLEQIKILDREIGISKLAPGLREAARARLEHPEATLQELADLTGIGKSGMNHRFRKIAEMASQYKA